jgi:DNA-binding transcriptional ArsR family regulator
MLKRPSRSRMLPSAAPAFAALGVPVRLAMVARLCQEGPLPTNQLQRGTRVSRQAITKHLRTLEETGLISSVRVGRDRQWELQANVLASVLDYLEQISAQWDRRIERLRNFVEDSVN